MRVAVLLEAVAAEAKVFADGTVVAVLRVLLAGVAGVEYNFLDRFLEVNSIVFPKVLLRILPSFVKCPNCSASSTAQSRKDFPKWSIEFLIDNPTKILVLRKCN